MSIEKKNLFQAKEGEAISVTLRLSNGSAQEQFTVELMNIGAGIRRIERVSADGSTELLTLSYADPSAYLTNGSLAGLTIGPNAGRIPAENGLAANEGENQLHGGPHHLAARLWQLESLREGGEGPCASFVTEQADGLDGWPGNRRYRVTYTLSSPGILTIRYEATTDRPSYINMTNHTYWRMEGLSALFIRADSVCVNDESFLPVRISDAASFFTSLSPSLRPLSAHPAYGREIPFELPLNNGFILAKEGTSLQPAACLAYRDKKPVSVYTDAPALVAYTGDYLDGEALLPDKSRSFPRVALALEAQDMPTLLPRKLTTEKEPFSRMIQYHLSC